MYSKSNIGGLMKKILASLLVVLVGGYFFAGYYVYSQATSVTCVVWEGDKANRPNNFSLTEKDVTWDPSKYFVTSYETVDIPVEGTEIVLNSWWMEYQSKGPTVIVLHGLTSSKYSPDMLLVAGMLYNNGFNVLAIDMRDHGDSTCEDGYHSAGQKESDDVVASLNWLINEKQISASKIGIYGSSLGALVGLLTPAKSNDFEALAVVDAPFDFKTLVREEMTYQGFPPVLFEPLYHYVLIFERINLLENSPEGSLEASKKQPILIFNGLDNDRVLSHHTDDLINAAEKNSIKTEVHRYKIGHTRVMYDYPDEFENLLIKFFINELN